MKFFAFVLLSVFATALAAPSETNELTASEEQFVDNFVKNYGQEIDRYVKTTMKELAEKICSNKDTDLQGPLEEVIKRASEVEEGEETVCNCVQSHLYHVLEPMVTAIDGCLPNSEAGVADYIVKAIISVVSKVCQSTGEQLLELINPCLDEVDLSNSKCLQNVEDKWNEITKTGTKSLKDVICSEYTDARPCFQTAVTDKCKLEITQQSIMGLLDSALQTPCHA